VIISNNYVVEPMFIASDVSLLFSLLEALTETVPQFCQQQPNASKIDANRNCPIRISNKFTCPKLLSEFLRVV
jgi:hypothetical protein